MIEDSKELDKENEYSKLEVLVDYTILFIVSLAPTLWLRGTVLLTEDFNLPKLLEIIRYLIIDLQGATRFRRWY